MTCFADATAIRRVSSHVYEATFPPDWCIGSVPHGGYVTSCFQSVAREHYQTTLSRQSQPHTTSLHLEFLRRTETGPATFTVTDVKLGRATSTIHVVLSQNGRVEVVGYLTNANLAGEGLSLDTRWALNPAPHALIGNSPIRDPHWTECRDMPFKSFRQAAEKVCMFLPSQGQPRDHAIVDQWMTFRNGERFTSASLGFVADTFAQLIEVRSHDVDPYYADEIAPEFKGIYWYPTLLLNLDVKKTLPKEGVDWLFVRAQAKQIKNGRYDLEVIIVDQGGDLVALSHHVCMVLDAQRNLAKRASDGSKL